MNVSSSYHSSADAMTTDVTNGTGYTHYDVITSSTTNDKCIQNNNLFTIAFIPFKLLVMMMNIVLFAAATRDREKLQRQNYTFHCVVSTLASNTVYLAISIWLTVDNYPQLAMDPQQDQMSTEKYIWIFSEAATTCIIIGIYANVTSLIYVTLDSVFYVSRTGTDWGHKIKSQENVVIFKVRLTQLLVAASWILPVLLTSITFAWNCAKECRCPSNNFQGEHCPAALNCSHMWAPMKIQFLYVVLGIWALQVIGLVLFLISGIRRHFRSFQKTDQEMEAKNNKEDHVPCELDGDVSIVTSRGPEKKHTSPVPIRRTSILKRKFNSRLKFAISLALLLIFCTTPASVCTLIDCLTPNPPYTTLVAISAAFMFLYCSLCPVVMWKFLPGLRSSALKFLIGAKSCSCVTACNNKPTRTVS